MMKPVLPKMMKSKPNGLRGSFRIGVLNFTVSEPPAPMERIWFGP